MSMLYLVLFQRCGCTILLAISGNFSEAGRLGA